ncbi:hypothetical protein LSTR_LSTR016472 [Laodelphax striatellus]|uniref:Uncharacterized protein n=1 Tax=Laodelphax striatellus TaxID=195883 RepID=A0A482X916_LAOST|nr:hypothetical protein LSTR_LSTR016472 [Laodelphax striatellus]
MVVVRYHTYLLPSLIRAIAILILALRKMRITTVSNSSITEIINSTIHVEGLFKISFNLPRKARPFGFTNV